MNKQKNLNMMKKSELVEEQTLLNNEDKQDFLKKFEKVENTPFTIYGSEDEGYCLLMGNSRLTEVDSYENTKKNTKITWDRILQVMIKVIEHKEELKKLND